MSLYFVAYYKNNSMVTNALPVLVVFSRINCIFCQFLRIFRHIRALTLKYNGKNEDNPSKLGAAYAKGSPKIRIIFQSITLLVYCRIIFFMCFI